MEQKRLGTTEGELNFSIIEFNGFSPLFGKDVFLASGCRVIGDLVLGDFCSVWFNTVIRADIMPIRIGEETNIQDNCTLHVTSDNFPLNIGARVTIGHNAVLHGCTVEDEVLIGMGSIVLDGAVVKRNSLVAAGSVVKPGFVVEEGVMVAGAPAKVVRRLTEKEIDNIFQSSQKYRQYAFSFMKGQNG